MSSSAFVQAAVVSYNFTGQIDSASDPLGSFGISPGDAFVGSFTYDTTLGVFSSGPGNVIYQQGAPIAPSGFNATINGVSYTAADSSAPLQIQVTNNAGGLHDQFAYVSALGSFLVHPLSASYPFSTMSLTFHDTSANVFSGTSIPSSLSLNDFDVASFGLNLHQDLGDPGTEALFLGTIVTLTPVPEPSTLAIGLGGLPLLILLLLKRRRSLRSNLTPVPLR